jgi:hypothetical protein
MQWYDIQMKPKLILCLALVLSGGLFGCKSISDSRVDIQRQHLTTIYQDKTQPMTNRVAAFDSLLETFKAGTPCTVLDKYVGWPVEDTASRLVPPEYGQIFQLHLNAPDGSDRWITLKGEFPTDQVVAY